MFVCLECGNLFNEPAYWEETHGLECGPYEKWSGCPSCYGAYTKVYICDCCNDWIVDDYIKIEDKRYCQECCESVELGRE